MIALAAVASVAVLALSYVCRSLLRQLDAERDRHRDQTAELLNRIQHPAVFQPTPTQEQTIRQTTSGRAESDEFELAGTVQPAGPSDTDDYPLPVGEMR